MILNKKIPLLFLLKTARRDIFYITLFTILTITAHFYFNFPTMPIAISAFLGTAISLILSFRLAQSYDRWWEARQIWGAIVNDSRTLVLQLQSFCSPHEKETVTLMAKRHIAWTHLFAHQLRQESITSQVDDFLNHDDQKAIVNAPHKPLYLLSQQTKALHTLESLDSYKKMQIDTTLLRLTASMGEAERIKNTVFPAEYPLYLHFSIYLFLGFLSISLANMNHHWEISLLIIIAAPFFLLEKAAEHLQDPFENRPTDVPISSISRNIEINILSLLGEKELPEPLQAQEFYIN